MAVGASDEGFLEVIAGLKAEARTWAILSAGQVVFILSGNLVSSRTRTSDSERRPRRDADAKSSFLRIEPRFSALPTGVLN